MDWPVTLCLFMLLAIIAILFAGFSALRDEVAQLRGTVYTLRDNAVRDASELRTLRQEHRSHTHMMNGTITTSPTRI